MNSVHELDSRTMSKNLTHEKYRVKLGQKQAECTECTALGQPARPAPRPRAPRLRPAPVPRPPRAPPTARPAPAPFLSRAPLLQCLRPLARPCRAAPNPRPGRLAACPARPASPACAPSASTPSAQRLHAQLPSLCCIVTQAYLGSQYSLYCNTNLQPTKLFCNTVSSKASHLYCNTISPLTIQFYPSSLQYNFVLQLNLHYFCNTIHSLAIQKFSSQYDLGSSPSKSAPFFFFIIIIILIFFFYFQ